MPYSDEYNTWLCDDPDAEHPEMDCESEWVLCDECDNHWTHEGTDCDCCQGSGGGHVCSARKTMIKQSIMKPQINSYYFGFDATGDPAIDKILDAVACAGHSFHNTQDWNDKLKNLEHAGETPVEWIQNAANEAAKSRKNEN